MARPTVEMVTGVGNASDVAPDRIEHIRVDVDPAMASVLNDEVVLSGAVDRDLHESVGDERATQGNQISVGESKIEISVGSD